MYKDNRDEDEIKPGKIIAGCLVFLMLCLALDWVFAGQNFFLYRFFAPREEAVRRQVYEQTKSFQDGSKRRLGDLCNQAATADEGHKPMINDMIVHEFSSWNLDEIPDYLRSCVATARNK
jgi:hypothetical protein